MKKSNRNFNRSHVNPTVKRKVFKAMLTVLRRGTVDHIRTSKGDAYLAVRLIDGLYEITDRAGKNVAECFSAYPMIYNNLRGV